MSLNILIDRAVFDYIPFPVLTNTKGMTHFQNLLFFVCVTGVRYFDYSV